MVRTAEASQKELKRKLGRMIRILEDRYGPHIYPDERSLLDQLVFAVLAAENPVTNARKAVRDFKERYVDWNEVRVSTIRQFEETLEGARIEPKGALAQTLKELLKKTFHELCRMDLDHLKGNGAEQARKFAAKLDMLKPHEQQYLLLAAGFDAAPPLDPATERICSRIGVFRLEEPAQKRRRALEAVVSGVDAVRFHHLMVEHGKKLCTVESPKCARCLLQTDCEWFRTEAQRKKQAPAGAGKKASARPAAPKRAVGTRGAAKPSPSRPAKGRRAQAEEE